MSAGARHYAVVEDFLVRMSYGRHLGVALDPMSRNVSDPTVFESHAEAVHAGIVAMGDQPDGSWFTVEKRYRMVVRDTTATVEP